jgi:hypothetical protein
MHIIGRGYGNIAREILCALENCEGQTPGSLDSVPVSVLTFDTFRQRREGGAKRLKAKC